MKNLLFLIIFVCVSMTLLGCEKEDFFLPEMENVHDDTQSVLIIGNSYSRDAFSYVPALLQEAGINVDISILCLNGKALSTHYDVLQYNRSLYQIDTYDCESHRWYTYTDTTALSTIISEEWKLVIIQEGSNAARVYQTTSNNVYNVKAFLKKALPYAYYSYMVNPPHPLGHSTLEGTHNNEEYEMIKEVANDLVKEGFVSDIVPCGTAIQNARQTDLQQLGDYGDLSYEGKHLQEGLPCLIEAYVGAAYIANFFHYPFDIYCSSLKTNQTWVNLQHIPGKHGRAIEGDEDLYELCKTVAIEAVNHPLKITFK